MEGPAFLWNLSVTRAQENTILIFIYIYIHLERITVQLFKWIQKTIFTYLYIKLLKNICAIYYNIPDCVCDSFIYLASCYYCLSGTCLSGFTFYFRKGNTILIGLFVSIGWFSSINGSGDEIWIVYNNVYGKNESHLNNPRRCVCYGIESVFWILYSCKKMLNSN